MMQQKVTIRPQTTSCDFDSFACKIVNIIVIENYLVLYDCLIVYLKKEKKL